MSVLRLNLSTNSIRQARERLDRYVTALPKKVDELCLRLAQIGVDAAVANVKVDTGALADGISFLRKGDGEYLVVSVGDYAAFVEFGTGVVGSGTYQGDLPAGWQYDTRETPEAHDPDDPTRWYYYDAEGNLRSTRGQRAASYMSKAAEEMHQKVLAIAKEVLAFE